MKLGENRRRELFDKARSLHPMLGDVFQNEMDIISKDLNYEIDKARRAKQEQAASYQRYIDELGMLLCFGKEV